VLDQTGNKTWTRRGHLFGLAVIAVTAVLDAAPLDAAMQRYMVDPDHSIIPS
jgi:hypothetical protein